MNVDIEQRCAVTLVKPSGAINGDDADELKSIMSDIIKANMGRVVIDAGYIPSVDSRALEILVDLSRQLARSGKALKLCSVNETLKQVIELTGLSSEFEQFHDSNSAIRSFL